MAKLIGAGFPEPGSDGKAFFLLTYKDTVYA